MTGRNRLFGPIAAVILTVVACVAVAVPAVASSPACCVAASDAPGDGADCQGAPCCRVTAPAPKRAVTTASTHIAPPLSTVLPALPAIEAASSSSLRSDVVPHARSAPLFLALSVLKI